MSESGTEKNFELLEGQVALRYDLVRKKIDRYFQRVEKALNKGQKLPSPDEPDEE
ncbi:MAG: hypothetical protein M5R36_10755 [Deltaproteobacteria bacterium]|nr:hypothetical protein [Deltaproteobacteria bacterium]